MENQMETVRRYDKAIKMVASFIDSSFLTQKKHTVGIISHSVDNDGIGALSILNDLFTRCFINVKYATYDHSMEKDYSIGNIGGVLGDMIYDMVIDIEVDFIIVTDLDLIPSVYERIVKMNELLSILAGVVIPDKSVSLSNKKPIVWIDHHSETKKCENIEGIINTEVVASAHEYESAISMCNYVAREVAEEIGNRYYGSDHLAVYYRKCATIVRMLSDYDCGTFTRESVYANDYFNLYREYIARTGNMENLLPLMYNCMSNFNANSLKTLKNDADKCASIRNDIMLESLRNPVYQITACDENGEDIELDCIDISNIALSMHDGSVYRLLSVVARYMLERSKEFHIVHWCDGKTHSFRSTGDRGYALMVARHNGGSGHPNAAGSTTFTKY
jgi:transcriptional antiterminator Rof (Rho-off)